MTWIRIDTDTPDNHKVAEFHNRICPNGKRHPFPQTVGMVVMVWFYVADHATAWDGNLKKVLDEQLEGAAFWRGEEGIFAHHFREVFCDGRGRIKGWLERQGKMIAYKKKNAKRMREHRAPHGA